MAELGIGILIVPQKPWESAVTELDAYREVYREVNGTEAPPPICAAWVFCDPDPGRAAELGRHYIGEYYETVLRHYELASGHLATTKGYEYYGKMTEALTTHGTEVGVEFFRNLQVYGTPEQCLEKMLGIRSMVGNDSFVAVCSYAGMPYEEGERNLRLFASDIMPELGLNLSGFESEE